MFQTLRQAHVARLCVLVVDDGRRALLEFTKGSAMSTLKMVHSSGWVHHELCQQRRRMKAVGVSAWSLPRAPKIESATSDSWRVFLCKRNIQLLGRLCC